MLALTIIASIIFYSIILEKFPVFGEYYNLLCLGLTLLFFGVGVFLSALMLGRGVRESK